MIVCKTRCDLKLDCDISLEKANEELWLKINQLNEGGEWDVFSHVVETSSLTGEGMDNLMEAVKVMFGRVLADDEIN